MIKYSYNVMWIKHKLNTFYILLCQFLLHYASNYRIKLRRSNASVY